MSGDINKTNNFKSAKIWIMFLFYVLSFFQKRGHYSRGDLIQGRTLFKEILYLPVEGHHVGHHISRIFMIPMLSPHKFQRFIFGQMFFDGIMSSLDQHIVKSCSFQNIGHGWWQPKGINCPSITEKNKQGCESTCFIF